MNVLRNKAALSRTSAVWIDCLIKPVMIMMYFVRAEREYDFSSHLWAVTEMVNYFFAVNHFNYARYCLYYLRSMESLPSNILEKYLNAEHMMCHRSGLWNAKLSNVFIDTTFMRHGKGDAEIIGITLKPSTVKHGLLVYIYVAK